MVECLSYLVSYSILELFTHPNYHFILAIYNLDPAERLSIESGGSYVDVVEPDAWVTTFFVFHSSNPGTFDKLGFTSDCCASLQYT
jgi:hypothetical protein